MSAALGSSDKGVEELSQNDWLAIQLPKEILSHGGKLAHHFRTLALDAPDAAKRDVLRRFDSLKKESTKEFPATLFEGEDLDRIRIFNSKDTAELKSFQTSTPSAVLRELQLCQTPTSANNHQVTCFQTSYCFQRHLDLLARCVHASSRPDPNANTKYPVSAHDPAIFPEKLFSLASCRLQLEMLSSFRQINPTFYRNGMRILIRTVLECPPQALQHIAPKTAEAAMLQSMFEFCTHVIQDSSSTPPEKLSALSLLLALGESSGLARHLLVVVESLLLNRVGAAFPDDTFASEVTDVVARFEAYRVTFDLGSISAKTIKSIRLQEDDDSVCGTIASDGKYLYAFTGQGLSKLGTGYRGTILGNVYATQPLDTFMEWLGWDASKEIPYFVYVVLVQQKLFVWFVRRQVDAKMVPFLFELSVEDLDMVARDCDDAGTVDLIENATNVEFCSDGLHMFVIATTSSSSLSWRKLDPADNWACLQHETLDESHVGKEGRDMLTGEMLPFFYTNGHILTGTLKKDKKLKELSIALATSVVQYTEYESALTPHAICFDAPNNLLWSTSAKSVQCHANTGTQVILRPARVLNPALVAAIQPQPSLTSRVVGLRLLSHLESIVDAYLPDDINHMDVTGHAAKIVFAVDVHESTFQSLMEMVSSFADAAGALTEWQEYVVVVCLKMLSLNTLHWLVHKTHAIADVVLKLNFPAVLKSLIATSSNSHIVDAARMLFVLSIDIFHTTISAQWQLLVSYIDKFHHKTLAPEERSVVTLLLDRLASKRKTQDAVQEAVTADFDGMHWFEKLVQFSVVNMSLQVANDEDKSLVEVGEKLTHLVHSVVHGVLGGVWGHILPVSVLLDVFRIVLNGCIDMCELDGTSTDLLESSVLGQVVASLVGFTQTILVADGQLDNRDQWDVAALTDMTRQVLSLLEKLVPLVASVHRDDQEMSIDVQYVGKSSVDMESAHEYANDTHELKELRLDGATSMTITFDSRCRTELNYDYVTFYHDRSCSAYYGDEKYSGRDSSFNWPGVGSIPPLVIESDSCVVLFHSDGSTVDWGFKFTAVANVSENNVSLHLHWLVAVEEQLTNLLSTVATLGSTWMPLDAALETDQAQFLDNDLLHGGVDDATDDDTEVSAFLRDLIELNTPDSPAAHVAKTLKQHTIQDQGAVAHINRAVRAVAAAMLHHNMSSVDAYALGQGRATNPNPALLKAWKNAQKMRNWFDVGDAKRPTRHPDESSTSPPSSAKPKLTRQPSAYVGASDDSLRTLCANVEERATFLLSLAPASFSLATASDDPTGAKKRWNLLAQYGTALKQGDTNAAAILKKWHLLVDEVEAATELKRKMLYRKQSAGRYQGSHEKTVTELVLEFVQSDVVVSDLAAAVQLRNRRAQFRLLTLTILFRTSEISRNGRLVHTLVERVSTSLSELDANKVHFSTHTHGCSLSLRNNLRGEFAKVLQVFAKVLRHVNSTPPLVGSVLKCIAMDYDIKEDAHLLFQSSIVPAVFNLLLSAHPVVRNAAQATARVLLERFMVKEKESHVQKLLCTRVQHYVDQVHGSVGGAGVFLPQQACFLTSDAASFVSLGLWVYVPRIEWRPLRQGDLVVVGPQWTDGPQAQPTGVVLAVHGNDISVEWHAQGAQKAKKGFHKYDVASTVLEVIPADQDPRGQILLRTNHTDTPWGQLCLRLTTEVKLEASVSLGPSQSTTIIGTDPIPVDTWQYVVLNRENDVLQMTIQGEVAAQVPLCDVLKAHGPTHPRHVVESAHPFHGQAEQWSFFPVSIPNATLVRITFDAQSNLTQASNYIAIYSDTTMEIAYGENMYNQAFGNFPGVGDNTGLEIPSGDFVVGLYTEDTSELWGFRITVQVVESSTLISNNANNNTAFQVYFGESPSRVSNEKAAACYIEDFKLFDTAPPSGCPKSTPPPPPHFELEVHASKLCLHALSLVNVCLVSQNEYGSQVISPSASLHHVLDLAFSPTLPVSVRCCATTVVSRLLSNAQVDVADLDVYIAKAFATIASTVDPWANKPSQLFRPSASDAMWLSTCYAAFLRACCHQIDWGGSISTTLMQKLTDPHAFDQLLAALAVLGGTVDGVFVGSRVSCLVKRDAVEVGTLLKFELVGGQRMARVLFDMDMTKVDSINLDKIMTANKRTPLYLTTLYDRLNPSMHALVDVLHGLNVPASSPTQQQQHLEAQSRLLKAIYLLIHHQPQASVIPLLRPALTELALSQHDGMLLGVKPTQQVFESRHPYRDGQDVYETVFVKNAKSLRISFDAASRTEQGCDYVTFYKDSSHSQRWGDDTYSGRDGSENFPGCGGRPALDIPADSFVLFWHSDSSNNDWGYKFTVEATYKDIPASSFSTDELNQRMYHLSEVMYEQQQHHPSIKSSVTPVDLKGAANNVVEVVKPDQSTRSQDAFRDFNHETPIVEWTVEVPACTVYETQATSSAVLATLSRGDVVTAVEFTDDGWVHLDHGGVSGWCQLTELQSLRQVPSHPYLEFSTRLPGWDAVYTPLPKPDELTTPKRDDTDSFESHFNAETIAFTSADASPLILLAEFSQSATVQYAKECLRSYVSCGLHADDLSVATFGQLAQLFALEKSPIADTLGDRLKSLASQPEFASEIVSLHLSAAAAVTQSLPRRQTFAKVVQDMNRDSIETIYFPGASSIRIEFDKDTHCHETDEFVRVYDKQGVVGSKYQGPKGGGWPGVGTAEPLVVDSDTAIVQFEYVSDTGATRLIRFTAYGEYRRDRAPSPPLLPPDFLDVIQLSLWVFCLVAPSPAIPSTSLAAIVDMSLQLYQVMPERIQAHVIALWAALLTNPSVFNALTVSQIKAWVTFVKNKLRLQHESDLRRQSILLQRLVQTVVDMDMHLNEYLLHIEALSDTFTNFEFESGSTRRTNITAGPVLLRTTQGVSSGRHAWDIHIQNMTRRVDMGIVAHASDTFLIAFPQDVPLNHGDVVGFELDLHLNVVTIKRNEAVVGSHPVDVITCSLYPAVVLHDLVCDRVHITKQPPLRAQLWPSIAQNPPWYNKLVSSVRLLRGLNAADSPSTIHISSPDSEGSIPGAEKLHVHVRPSSVLAPDTYLALTNPKTNSSSVLVESANHLLAPSPHLETQIAPTDMVLTLVSRGSDWQYGNDDGAPGNVGVVLSVESWQGVAKSGVRVQWLHNDTSAIYRYGYHGLYDVQAIPVVEAMNSNAVVVDGDAVQIHTKPKPQTFFKGSLHFDGTQQVHIPHLPSLDRDFTIQLWVKLDKVEASSIFHIASEDHAWWMGFSLTSSHQLTFTICDKSEEAMSVTTSTDFERGGWHRVDVCACGSMIAVHLDSKLLGHQRLASKLTLESSACRLTLGANPSTSVQKLHGHMFGLRIWNAPLHLRDYSEFFINDERHLIDECPTFDQLAIQSSVQIPPRYSPSVEAIPRAIVAKSQALSAMTFDNQSMHFASLRTKYLGIVSPTTSTPTKVYYEVTLFTACCVQIGWSFKECAPSGATSGIGDCKLSFGLNTVAQSKCHGEREHISEVPWQAGDVVGCLLDWDAGVMTFSVNGRVLDNICFTRTSSSGSGGATQEINSPTASMLGGLWGDEEEEDEGDIVNHDDVCDDNANDTAATTDANVEAAVNERSGARPTVVNGDTAVENPANIPHNVPDEIAWLTSNVTVDEPVALTESTAPSTTDQVEVELEPTAELPDTDNDKPTNSATPLTTPISDNAWLQHGGIYPSLSFRSADGVRWNFGHTPLLHCPPGYVSIAQATQFLDRPVEFEKYDFEETKWQDVAFRHRVKETKPALVGEWLCLDGLGDKVADSSSHKRHGHVANEAWTSDVLAPAWNSEVGYALTIRPVFVKAKSLLSHPSLFEPSPVPGRQKEYLEIVRYVNSVCTARSMSLHGLLTAKWSSLAPDADALLRWPSLAELTEAKADVSGLFQVLVEFNTRIRDTLGFVELTSSTSRLATLVSSARGFIFGLVKHELWDMVLEQTKAPTSPDMALTLNRPKASRWKPAVGTSADFNRFALFAQAYRETLNWVPSIYCRTNNLYVVTFLGENSIDAGGPYRETLSQYCVELQSGQLPLLLPAPNGQHNVGRHRDAWVLHPNAHQHHAGMLVFLGKLLGVAIRSKYCLSLNLSQVVWKLLVQEPITLDDLEAIDTLVVSSMRSLRTIEQSGVTEEIFADIMHETMTTLSTDNRMVNLVDGGDSIPVTFANRHAFADLVESYRMHEFDVAASFVRQGLGMVVSLRLLRLFTWAEVEVLVCGLPEVDIDLLEKCTEYSGCHATDQHVVWFWEVLRGYNQEARQAFLRFVWGRSRLPRSVQEFQSGQQFKLQAFERHPADMYMPVSHTCFFSLELPRYMSLEVLSSRLTYAIYNCVAIDGDTNTMQANQLGWED